MHSNKSVKHSIYMLIGELNLKKDYSCGRLCLSDNGLPYIKFDNKEQQENYMKRFKK